MSNKFMYDVGFPTQYVKFYLKNEWRKKKKVAGILGQFKN